MQQERAYVTEMDRSQRIELEFRAVLNAAVDAVILIDSRGRIELINAAGSEIFGWSEDDLVGRDVAVLMPEPYRSRHEEFMRNYIETGQPRIIGIGREVEALRRDGTVFPAELSVGRIESLEPPHFVGIIRDITVRRNAEEALRRSESQLRIAQELAKLGNYIVHVDGEGQNYWSPQLFRIIGRDPDSPTLNLAAYLDQVVYPADRQRVEQAFKDLDTGLRPIDVEYRIRLPSGGIRYLHHIAQAVRGPDGRVLRHVGTLHDITDRRHAEDEIRQMQERLTHFSRLSTMGEMAAGLAHEINQPLTAIATYARACQRLLESGVDFREDLAGALEQIGNQALRAGEVIRRLRSFVKNREVRREPVDVDRLLDDLITLAETDARHNSVRIRLEKMNRGVQVHADPVQIQQVILNLVRNSIDAMLDVPESLREIELRMSLTDYGDVNVMVADRGTGIAPEVSAQLSDPFFTTKPGGTGLGLAISRSIIRAHGGKLWWDDNPGGGARFFFTLPAAPALQITRDAGK